VSNVTFQKLCRQREISSADFALCLISLPIAFFFGSEQISLIRVITISALCRSDLLYVISERRQSVLGRAKIINDILGRWIRDTVRRLQVVLNDNVGARAILMSLYYQWILIVGLHAVRRIIPDSGCGWRWARRPSIMRIARVCDCERASCAVPSALVMLRRTLTGP